MASESTSSRASSSVEGDGDGRAIVRERAIVVERGRPRATEGRGGDDGGRAHDGG